MSAGSTDIWQSPSPNPLLWMTMAAVALVAHLTLLQVGITAYQAQVSIAKTPRSETTIITSALQIAGAEVTPPAQLEAIAVAPATTEQAPLQRLKPDQPAPATLPATLAPSPLPQVSENQRPEPVPEVEPIEATTPIDRPGVAPAANAPVQDASVARADVVTSNETLEVAVTDAPTVTGVEPAAVNSIPPPPSEAQSGIASANVPTQTTEKAQDTYDTVLDFLRGFDGGPCFAALPVLAEDGAFRFETFARSTVDLKRFRQALELETGTLPGTVMKPVSDAQCQALPFVTAAARYPEFQLYFDLAAREIPSGEVLSGKLGNTSGGFVSLLLIDDEGVVQDLGGFLKFRQGYAGFDIPMTLKGSPVETQQLLMALSTRARLKTLQSLSGQPAEDVFQKLAVEIALQGGGEDVALVAFSVR